MRIALAAALLAAMTTDAAACHRFSVWHYPWRQSCGVASRLSTLPRSRLRVGHEATFVSHPVFIPKIGIDTVEPSLPLPSLARADLDEPEADEPTRGRVLLRAALEAANGN